jgi:hypothetical protein
MTVDRFADIAELVEWAATQPDPDRAMSELADLDRAAYPDWYAEMDAAYIDVDDDLLPESDPV